MQFGYSLIEVVSALLVISMGVFAALSLQQKSLHAAQSTYWTSVAITQAQSLIEMLLANKDQKARDNELENENPIIASMLPEGLGSYQCVESVCEVRVQWQDGYKHIVSLQREHL